MTNEEKSEGETIAKKIIIDAEVYRLQRNFETLGLWNKAFEPLLRATLSRVWDAVWGSENS
jgi:hypothetical protein